MLASRYSSRTCASILAGFAAFAAFAACSAPCASAVLVPQEVAVVAARGNRESEQLARYYIKARGIPVDHLCLIDVPDDETCPREQWTWAIRPEIRKWLDEHDRERKLRCLVTVRGVPLKVAPVEVDPNRIKYRQLLIANRRQRLDLLKRIGEQLDGIAPDVAVPGLPPISDEEKQRLSQATDLQRIQVDIEKRLQLAQARASMLQGDEIRQATVQLQQLAILAGGARVVMGGMERQLKVQPDSKELRQQYDMLRGRVGAFLEMQYFVEQAPMGFEHDALTIAALERNGGVIATVDWIDQQLSIFDKNETGASLDSELALVLWSDDYELLRWQPNYLRAGYEVSPWRRMYPTIMVCRIDAPTPALARKLIDVAIATEKQGLQGKAYIDARGLTKPDGPTPLSGSYEDYDRALLTTARGLQEQTTVPTVLDESPELFSAGECPDAALYCGWYSLAKYVDAFDWKPGAVAYHLASGEAETLHMPDSQVWCKRMIEDGVAATMGPVYEPYLAAFPRPEQFFGLLLQGELTLVECYYRTLPYNSWMMTLIGDPLYRPFVNRKVRKAGSDSTTASELALPDEAAPAVSQ
jgi:uncharacterized protein (TIGR03790 family)